MQSTEVHSRTIITESEEKNIMECFHHNKTEAPDEHQLEGQPIRSRTGQGGEFEPEDCPDHPCRDDPLCDGYVCKPEGGNDLTSLECANYCKKDPACNGFYFE